MIRLFYCDITKISDWERHIKNLPPHIKADILRYKIKKERKYRLAAALMLQHCINTSGKKGSLENLYRDQFNKPHIQNWNEFNISHSGNLVLVVYNKLPIGVDIEEEVDIDFFELLDYILPIEKEYIINSLNSKKAFYEVWVKKEALLKAVGVGLVGLKSFSCLRDSIEFKDETWYFHHLNIIPEYTCYVCSLENSPVIVNEIVI